MLFGGINLSATDKCWWQFYLCNSDIALFSFFELWRSPAIGLVLANDCLSEWMWSIRKHSAETAQDRLLLWRCALCSLPCGQLTTNVRVHLHRLMLFAELVQRRRTFTYLMHPLEDTDARVGNFPLRGYCHVAIQFHESSAGRSLSACDSVNWRFTIKPRLGRGGPIYWQLSFPTSIPGPVHNQERTRRTCVHTSMEDFYGETCSRWLRYQLLSIVLTRTGMKISLKCVFVWVRVGSVGSCAVTHSNLITGTLGDLSINDECITQWLAQDQPDRLVPNAHWRRISIK